MLIVMDYKINLKTMSNLIIGGFKNVNEKAQ